MTRVVAAALLLTAIVTGTLADRPRAHVPLAAGGYRILQVDFHTHSSTWSDGALTPFGLVLERAQGLDAIAITGHNQVSDARVGRWFSRAIGGPVVLIGEEVLMPHHHIIAAGISERVDFLQNARDTIDEIHRRGGIAIAAHPRHDTTDYDAAAKARLDGAEICHPMAYVVDDAQPAFEAFAAAQTFAAIGSSDYHGIGVMGACRTYVFATENSEAAILDAVRARRTVVFGPHGRAYGDPALVPLVRANGLGETIPQGPRTTLDWISGIAAVLGFAVALLPDHFRT